MSERNTNPTDDESSDEQFDERVENVSTGVKMKVATTRGEGTRDQDKFEFQVKAENYDEAIADLKQWQEDLEAEVLDRQRNIQFGEGEEDDD